MFTPIRIYFGNLQLRKELSKVEGKRKLLNLKDARKIGIIYILNDVQDYDTVASLVAALQHDHKEIKALGFVKYKNMVSRFLPKLSFDFFSAGGLNWYFKPVDPKVRDFIREDYDLLLDLSLTDMLPMKYITGLSKAHCRVGRFDEKNKECYDLMIRAGEGITLKEHIDQILHYLTVINSNEQQ